MSFYFVIGRGYGKKNQLNGISLGLTYDKGLPHATKEILTKIKLTDEEKSDLYFFINETEHMISDENTNIYSDMKLNYFNNFYNKLNSLTSFTKNINKKSQIELSEDIYWNIFQYTFISINEIARKIKSEHYYFINRRRMATEIFLKSISNNSKNSCYIVYPLIKSDATLFDENDQRSQRLLNLHLTLLKNGHRIERIFIINKNYKFTDYFRKIIEMFIHHGMIVKIAFIEDIDILDISSYDFVYSKEVSGAIYRNIRDKICFFKVTKIKGRKKQLSYDFEKIEKVSYVYDEFLMKKNLKKDKILERLVGTWHYYAYGSLIMDMAEFRLWHSMVTINKDGTAHYKYKNMTQHSGDINTTYSQNQSYIRFTNRDSSHFALIMIDNKNIYKDIFKVTMIRKQFGTTLDMATFGIFSRKELDETLVKKALGDTDKVMLRESIDLEKRINELYIKSRF